MPPDASHSALLARTGAKFRAAAILIAGGVLAIVRSSMDADLLGLPWVMMTAGIAWFGGGRWGLGFAMAATLYEVLGFEQPESRTATALQAIPLAAILSIVAVAVANWRVAQDEAVRNATTDELTGLLNRRGFRQAVESEISRAGRMERGFAVASLDCDRFKAINDSLGHPAGDVVLRGIATILREGTRRYDAVARLGGDEFGVLLPETSAESAVEVIRRLQDAVAHVSHEPAVRLSAGIIWTVGAGTTHDELLEKADRELLKSKQSGGCGLSFSTLEPGPEPVQRP